MDNLKRFSKCVLSDKAEEDELDFEENEKLKNIRKSFTNRRASMTVKLRKHVMKSEEVFKLILGG